LVVARNRPLTFGKYTLIERIAVGGMAEVFLAVQAGLEGFEKRLAIKRIRPHLSGEEAFLRMFLNEAKLAAQLQHPNIVQIYDLGRIGDAYFIAMEYVQGRDMSRVIPKCERLGIQFPIEYAVQVGTNALDGLYHAHTKCDADGKPLNIVHRDVTPENIMVGWNGAVKILDFGIAKATTQADQTKAGEIKGKLSYMSPEQAMGKTLDARSDIFSTGIVLYEWLTGYKLFTGENEMAILKSIIDGKIYPPSYFREDIPEGLEQILMKALAKDREHRYQSARDMQLDLTEWLSHHEFAPSSAHLANFMKQLFQDEIAAEQRAFAQSAALVRRTPTPPPPKPEEAVQPGEAVGRAKTPVDGQQARSPALIVVDDQSGRPGEAKLSFSLPPSEAEKLRAAAERAGVSIEEVVRDLIRTAVKYL
jgi:eukaryotic-like serine/threonine-protein kinase